MAYGTGVSDGLGDGSGETVVSGVGDGSELTTGNSSGDGDGDSVTIGAGVSEGVSDGEGPTEGSGELSCPELVEGVEPSGEGEGVVISVSYPFRRAITSQSNVPVSAPFNSLTTKPNGVLVAT